MEFSIELSDFPNEKITVPNVSFFLLQLQIPFDLNEQDLKKDFGRTNRKRLIQF